MAIDTPFNPKQFQFVRPIQRTGGDPIATLLQGIGMGIMTAQQRKEQKEEKAFERALSEAREARQQEEHDVSMQERKGREDERVKSEEQERVAGVKANVTAEVEGSLKDVFLMKRQSEISAALHRQYPDLTPEEVEGLAGDFANSGLSPTEAVDKMIKRKADEALTTQRKQPRSSASAGVSGARLERDQVTDEAILAADQAIAYLKEQYRNNPESALPPERWADQVAAFVNSKFEGVNQSTFQVRMKGMLDKARTELNLGEDLEEATPSTKVQ